MKKVNVIICEYISKEWIGESSNRTFAKDHDIDEKTVRQIKNIKTKNYSISIETLEKICEARDFTLSQFFASIKR